MWAAFRLWSARWVIALLLLQHLSVVAASQEFVTHNSYKIQAACLLNFAHYVTWPAGGLPQKSTAWQFCIPGPDPFGDVLDATFEGRT